MNQYRHQEQPDSREKTGNQLGRGKNKIAHKRNDSGNFDQAGSFGSIAIIGLYVLLIGIKCTAFGTVTARILFRQVRVGPEYMIQHE